MAARAAPKPWRESHVSHGDGFDSAYADRVFEPFERLHTAQEFEGTGVGLASVRRIIERHGGRVRAEGTVGQGASFSFTLGPDASAVEAAKGADELQVEE